MLLDTGKHSHVLLFIFVLVNDLHSTQGAKTFNINVTSRSRVDDDHVSSATTKRIAQEQAFLGNHSAMNIVDDRLVLVKEALRLVRSRRKALRMTGKKMSETSPDMFLSRNRREARHINNPYDEHVLDKRQIVSTINTEQNANFNLNDGGLRLRKIVPAHRLDKRQLPDFEEPAAALRTDRCKFSGTGTSKVYGSVRGAETEHRRLKKDLDSPVSTLHALVSRTFWGAGRNRRLKIDSILMRQGPISLIRNILYKNRVKKGKKV